MSIATRIQSMYENVGEVYDTITNVTLPEHKNIENIPRTIRDSYLEIINNGINVVYDNWEKVTGEGTSLTLTPTEEAPMDIVYKGNTYQDSTTGKNLLNCDLETIKEMNTFFTWNGNVGTYAGITITINDDNTIKINGTNNQSSNIVISIASTTNIADIVALSTPIKVSAGDISGSRTTYYVRVLNYTGTTSRDLYDNTDETITIENSIARVYIVILPSTTLNNVLFKPMIRLASITDNIYEPYTNGASPNPDYPQPIQVVSGDNSIEICGKNLFNKDTQDFVKGYYLDTNGVEQISGNWGVYYIPIIPNTPYSISGCQTNGGANFCWFTKDKTFISRIGQKQNYTNITSPSNASYIGLSIVWNTSSSAYDSEIMLNLGTTALPYEPYTGASYPINLNGNILDKTKLIDGWVRGSNGNYENTYTSTYSCTDFLEVKPNTTYSIDLYDYTGLNSGGIVEYNSGKTYIQSTNETQRVITFTTTENTKYIRFTIRKDSISEVVYTIGSSIPTPIELCKIGTYQDKIDKSKGNNLWNEEWTIGKGISSTNGAISDNTNGAISDYIPVDFSKNPNYYISGLTNTLSSFIGAYNSSKQFLGRTGGVARTEISLATNSFSSGTPQGTGDIAYIIIYQYKNTTDSGAISIVDTINVMLNTGTTALPYEPYGTGWYLKKEIGKYTFTGTEDIRVANTGTANWYYYLSYTTNIASGATGISKYYSWANIGNSNTNQGFIILSGYFRFRFGTEDTTTNYKTWLSTHNNDIYYPLATPTYTLIEGELLNQLEAIKMSYEGQTNLSQENNDLPFILNPSALEKV